MASRLGLQLHLALRQRAFVAAPRSRPTVFFGQRRKQLDLVLPISTTKDSTQDTALPIKGGDDATSWCLTWPHEGWGEKVVTDIVPSHRKPRTTSDQIAWRVVKLCRWGMDFATGMKGDGRGHRLSMAAVANKPLTESQWLVRFIFLESIAGVPGMVAATLRHLHSIRRLRPDQGWIKTLLEESYNERMHLLTFLEMYKPGWMMRAMIFAAQGVFYNTLFVGYLISPGFCHRFVGYLEEEAVHTYTRCLDEMDAGHTPSWMEPGFRIPDIAVQYWNMHNGKRTMRDLILYIRADEASHRGVNHTLANLDQVADPNPFAAGRIQSKHLEMAATKPAGLERDEAVGDFTKASRKSG